MTPTKESIDATASLLRQMDKQNATSIISTVADLEVGSSAVLIVVRELDPNAARLLARRIGDYLCVFDKLLNGTNLEDDIGEMAESIAQCVTAKQLRGAVRTVQPAGKCDGGSLPKYVVFVLGGEENEIDAQAAAFERALRAREA